MWLLRLRRGDAWRISLLDVAWLAFLASWFVAACHGSDRINAMDTSVYWCLLFLLHKEATHWQTTTWRTVLWGFLASGIVSAGYGSLESFYLAPLHTYPSHTSTFGNINFAGAYMALTLLVACSSLSCLSKRQNYGVVAGMAVMAFYLMRTGSRAAWLSLAAGLLCYGGLCCGMCWQKISWRRAAIAILFVSLCSILPLLQENWRTKTYERLAGLSQWGEGSLKVRLLVWHGTLQMIREEGVFGIGAGQFVHHFYRYRDTEEYLKSEGRLVDDPHNEWLRLLVEGGLVTVLTFLVLVSLSIARLLTTLRAAEEWPHSLLFLSLLLMLLLMACVASPIQWPASGVFLPLVTAWAARESRVRGYSLSPWGRYLAMLGGFTAMLPLAWWTTTRLVADVFFVRGQTALLQKHYASAAEDLEKAVNWHAHTLYRIEWGRALLASQQYARASQVLRESIEKAPELEAAYVDLGLCLVGLREQDEALAIWKKAVSLFPGSVTIHYNLAKLYLLVKQGDTAYRHLLWIGVLQPEQRQVLSYCLDLGLCHEVRGEFKEALLAYSKAKELYPLQPWPYWQTGLWMERFALYDQAFYYYEKVILLGQPAEQARAYYRMARIYEAERQWSSALNLYKRALAKDPSLPEAEEAIARIQSKTKANEK
jgi:tetratricopeptide (TPR) repeat protein